MNNIVKLFNKNIKSIKLKILIFGPDPKGSTTDPRITALRNKRIQIRDHLVKEGHAACFPEDSLGSNPTSPVDNAALAEVLLMKEYDIIIALIGTHGASTEAGQISVKADFAAKSLLFICDEHIKGYPYQACKLAEQLGAILKTFSYPNDLTNCHLLTHVSEIVLKIQKGKYFT